MNLLFFLKRKIASYIKAFRALDLTTSFDENDSAVTDQSGEGNNATLYSGRYASTDGVANKAIQADASAAGSANYYLTGKVRPTGTSCRVQINDTASGEDDITGLTSGVWQDFTSATFSAQTPSNIVVGWSSNSGFLAVACDWSDVQLVNATTGATVARYQLNESADSNLDGYPALDSVGSNHGTHTGCAGGTGEAGILQTAGMDWNKYRTLTTGVTSGGYTASAESFPSGDVTLNGAGPSGFYVIPLPAGILGDSVVVKGHVTITSGSPAIYLREGIVLRSNIEVLTTSGDFELSGASALISTSVYSNLTISDTDIPSEYTFTNLRVEIDGKNFLIPESDTTAGQDALGNAIAIPRPTNDTFNGFSASEYLQIPDNASLESVRSITVAIYNDGTTRDFVQAAGGASFVHSASNTLTTDQTGTHAYYVNGAATTTLAAGWNIVGITFDAGKDLSGGKCLFQNAKLLAYDPTALTADQQLQNFNAFKSQFGL